MGIAEELRDDLNRGGIEAVRALVGTAETYNLECKSQLDESQASLRQFSKAASAFANTEGGVILWGVDARLDPETRLDMISGAPLVEFPERLVDWLTRKTSGALFPAVPGIQHFAVLDDGGNRGVVLTYVPASLSPPHQATHSSRQYFVRTQSASEPMHHSLIASMFGRRPAPRAEVLVTVLELENSRPGGTTLKLQFSVANRGLVPARSPYFTIRSHPESWNYGKTHLENTGLSSMHFLNHRQYGVSEIDGTATGTDSSVVAPGGAMPACTARMPLLHPFEGRAVLLGTSGAAETTPERWRLEFAMALVPDVLKRLDYKTYKRWEAEEAIAALLSPETLTGGRYCHDLAQVQLD